MKKERMKEKAKLLRAKVKAGKPLTNEQVEFLRGYEDAAEAEMKKLGLPYVRTKLPVVHRKREESPLARWWRSLLGGGR